jgi:putative transposase
VESDHAAGTSHPHGSNAIKLKREFNAIKYTDPAWLDADGLPGLKSMRRDRHARPLANLERAYGRYVDELRSGKAPRPRTDPMGGDRT